MKSPIRFCFCSFLMFFIFLGSTRFAHSQSPGGNWNIPWSGSSTQQASPKNCNLIPVGDYEFKRGPGSPLFTLNGNGSEFSVSSLDSVEMSGWGLNCSIGCTFGNSSGDPNYLSLEYRKEDIFSSLVDLSCEGVCSARGVMESLEPQDITMGLSCRLTELLDPPKINPFVRGIFENISFGVEASFSADGDVEFLPSIGLGGVISW